MDPSAEHQELFGNYKTIEAAMAVSSSKPQQQSSNQAIETHHHHQDHHLHQKKPRPQLEQPLKCPRCDSTNTKFCYYNNYSLSQPRYFCKSCRRYWTKGGTLRNIPVGGGCRKNRRSSSSATARIRAPDQSNDVKMIPEMGNFLGYNDQLDLGLAFALLNKQQPGHHHLGFHDEQLPVIGNSSVDDDMILGNSTSGGGGAFGVSQNVGMENAGNNYAIGNAAGGLMDQTGSEPNKVLWGFPWQMNGEIGIGMNNYGGLEQYDSGKESWNNNGMMMMSSSWQGLLNTSPLI